MKNGKGPSTDENGSGSWLEPGLFLFGRLSSWIVAPVILAIILGKWLDRKFHTEPWLFLATVGLAFFISMFGVVKEGIDAMKKAEEKEKKDKKSENGKQ